MSELVVNETNPSIDSRRNYDTISTISVDEVFKKKMNFLGLVQQILGVIMVIFGGLYCLTIIGAILGVPFILIGLKMFKSGEAYKKSIITLEGGDIKEGLTLFSDAMKIYIIMIVV
ncbi:MAG: DUF5362 family protein, partial [Leptotrichiaceae bacterium]